MRVSDILKQKVIEIQSRLPVQMKGFENEKAFSEVLQSEITSSAQPKTASAIPYDKSELMNQIDSRIKDASAKYGIDDNLLRAVIKQESGYNPLSLSRTGAQGLMQLMPETADSLGVTDPWDITQNIDGGARYLRDQLNTFNGDLRLSLAAYNAGPKSVQKYNGVPPYAETRDYIQKVLKYYRDYSSKSV